MFTTTVFYLSSPFMPNDYLVILAIALDTILEVSGVVAILGLILS